MQFHIRWYFTGHRGHQPTKILKRLRDTINPLKAANGLRVGVIGEVAHRDCPLHIASEARQGFKFFAHTRGKRIKRQVATFRKGRRGQVFDFHSRPTTASMLAFRSCGVKGFLMKLFIPSLRPASTISRSARAVIRMNPTPLVRGAERSA